MAYETLLYEVGDDKVATVTLNRPDKLNSFNDQMRMEFFALWGEIRDDDRVNVVVLRANGRAFSAGVDVTERATEGTESEPPIPFMGIDPGMRLGPKSNLVWKPIVCAVQGIVAGGAQYWINESDIVICSDDAQFFDPHVTYGMTSACEPIGLRHRVPYGEAIRWALMGLDERMSADRALQIGLVSEIIPRDELWDHAHWIAATVAAKPSVATQGTVKAMWQSLDLTRSAALGMALMYVQLGNTIGENDVDRGEVVRPKPRIR
ncbi:MAG: enoyl-CoA hydratase/isomerase family protein [Acidobacteria bacterium]|nr:enoyl-CoA hydratase/isomerase family protein [Acidobacteriota bacterium]